MSIVQQFVVLYWSCIYFERRREDRRPVYTAAGVTVNPSLAYSASDAPRQLQSAAADDDVTCLTRSTH